MKSNDSLAVQVFTVAILLVLVIAPKAFAEGIETLTHDEYKLVMRGGQLYDKWYADLGLDLKDTHPAYPSSGKKSGAGTWRCKECHGWDYKGKDGAYSKGSHFTGIMGIRDYAGKSPDVIMDILKSENHAFGNFMPDAFYEALSLFVAYGQIEMDSFIDSSSKKVKGDFRNAERIYASTCSQCHGRDGRKINFKTPEQPEFVGTIANKNPWEALHKIRFGQPSSNMVNLLFLGIEEQVNLLSYCQTLPVK